MSHSLYYLGRAVCLVLPLICLCGDSGKGLCADQPSPTAPAAQKLRFQFTFAPWKDVLQWFAKQADLSLVMDVPPKGTFNYSDTREYTPMEAIDLLNSQLLIKGYTLVRRGRMLTLINLEDGIPHNLVEVVDPKSLDGRGEFELVQVVFSLDTVKPEEAEAEIKKFMGPQGSVVAIGKARQVLVTETAGRLRAIRSMLARMEGQDTTGGIAAAPQLEIYPIGSADPQSILLIMQALLANQPDVRLAIDPKTNVLIAMARPAQHGTIRATLAQLQREGQRVEVIRLTRLDPQAAVLSINRLFGSGDPTKGSSPLVDADLVSKQLMIRGSDAQILQIRSLLEKMGEPLGEGLAAQKGNVRTLPLNDASARSVLKQIEEIWPTLRANKLHIVTPSAPAPAEPLPQRRAVPGDTPTAAPMELPPPRPAGERSAALLGGARVVLVADERVPSPGTDRRPVGREAGGEDTDGESRPHPSPLSKGEATTANAQSKTPAPIIVTPGPNGLIIASEDQEALDEFEHLLNMLAEKAGDGGPVTVYYLRHSKASSVAETLSQMFAGGAISFGSLSGGGAPGGSNSAAAGAISRPAQGVLATGPVKITADQRLNALLVQANRADLHSIEQLLNILDQKQSPEDVALAPKPRMILVKNRPAQEIADIVKQIYADRMVQAPSNNQQPQMPAFMGRGGRRGGPQSGQPQRGADDVARLSVGVDSRTNSLIVAAPDTLFEEVQQLVAQQDVAAGEQDQTVRVVTLHRTSPSAIEQALAAFGGDSIQVNRTGQSTTRSGSSAGGSAAPSQSPEDRFRSFRRMMFGFPPSGGFGGSGYSRGGRSGQSR